MCFVIKLGRNVNHGERMNSIHFGGHTSKVKVMMGIIDKYGVRWDAALCVIIFSKILWTLNKSENHSTRILTQILDGAMEGQTG